MRLLSSTLGKSSKSEQGMVSSSAPLQKRFFVAHALNDVDLADKILLLLCPTRAVLCTVVASTCSNHFLD